MVSIVPAGEKYYEKTVRDLNLCNDAAFCLTAVDGDLIAGHIVYKVDGGKAEFVDLKAPDSVLADGLIRAALNSVLSKGINLVKCSSVKITDVLQKIAVKRFDGKEIEFDISNAFDKGC